MDRLRGRYLLSVHLVWVTLLDIKGIAGTEIQTWPFLYRDGGEEMVN